MSVDPDDLTPSSIRASSAEVITYGAPVLPGAMFMLACLQDIPIIGLPGCVMYHETSIFDLVMPRILSGEILTREDIITFGHGGSCQVCMKRFKPLLRIGEKTFAEHAIALFKRADIGDVVPVVGHLSGKLIPNDTWQKL